MNALDESFLEWVGERFKPEAEQRCRQEFESLGREIMSGNERVAILGRVVPPGSAPKRSDGAIAPFMPPPQPHPVARYASAR
jgi:hypothetical protein